MREHARRVLLDLLDRMREDGGEPQALLCEPCDRFLLLNATTPIPPACTCGRLWSPAPAAAVVEALCREGVMA